MTNARTLAAECKKLEREYARLHEYFETFNQLKQTISEHIVKAEVDPQAKERLNNFNRLFPNGFSELDKEVNKDLKELSLSFKQLEAQLKQLELQMKSAATMPNDNQ